mmetsp:Transcript_604/g.1981  ORF Transcript_604/g.1981 Transcript_604/m.1981 type:complete len:252 (-) Transcript_604:182-937(-)
MQTPLQQALLRVERRRLHRPALEQLGAGADRQRAPGLGVGLLQVRCHQDDVRDGHARTGQDEVPGAKYKPRLIIEDRLGADGHLHPARHTILHVAIVAPVATIVRHDPFSTPEAVVLAQAKSDGPQQLSRDARSHRVTLGAAQIERQIAGIGVLQETSFHRRLDGSEHAGQQTVRHWRRGRRGRRGRRRRPGRGGRHRLQWPANRRCLRQARERHVLALSPNMPGRQGQQRRRGGRRGGWRRRRRCRRRCR